MILIGTVLLEPNRWIDRDQPALRVADWLPRFAAAGFDGIELWENHWHLAAETDRAIIAGGPPPVRVFNSYTVLDGQPPAEAFAGALSATSALGAHAIKFNVSPTAPASLATMRDQAAALAAACPPSVRLRCECHAGTWLDNPEAVRKYLDGCPAPPFDVIVHAFALPAPELARWMTLLGDRVVAIHVQGRDEQGQWSAIDRHTARSRDTLRVLSDHGFCGDYTLEFTNGTAARGNNPEDLWQSALNELAFLRAELPSR